MDIQAERRHTMLSLKKFQFKYFKGNTCIHSADLSACVDRLPGRQIYYWSGGQEPTSLTSLSCNSMCVLEAFSQTVSLLVYFETFPLLQERSLQHEYVAKLSSIAIKISATLAPLLNNFCNNTSVAKKWREKSSATTYVVKKPTTQPMRQKHPQQNLCYKSFHNKSFVAKKRN